MQENENQERGGIKRGIDRILKDSEYDVRRIIILCIIGVLFIFFEVKVFCSLRSKGIPIILAGLFFGMMIFLYSVSCLLSGLMILSYITVQKFLKKQCEDENHISKKTYAWALSILLILLGLALQSCFWAFVNSDTSLWLLTGVLLLGMILPIIKLLKYVLTTNKEQCAEVLEEDFGDVDHYSDLPED